MMSEFYFVHNEWFDTLRIPGMLKNRSKSGIIIPIVFDWRFLI